MLNVKLAQPFVGLIVNRNDLLSRGGMRLFNRDEYVREAAAALLIERYENEGSNTEGFGDEDESPLIRFLNWLIQNQDAIKAFINMIMSLFVSKPEKINVV